MGLLIAGRKGDSTAGFWLEVSKRGGEIHFPLKAGCCRSRHPLKPASCAVSPFGCEFGTMFVGLFFFFFLIVNIPEEKLKPKPKPKAKPRRGEDKFKTGYAGEGR